MPTIDIEYSEFEKLLGLELHRNMEKVNEALEFVKGEVKLWDEKTDVMSVEIKDTSRPDVWNVEGLTRALRGFLGLEKGFRNYKIGKPIIDVNVGSRLEDIRPYIGCSIVKDVSLSDAIIRGLMHMQDKLDQSYGRNRQRTSIGLYDFDLLKPPLSYTVSKPTEISFVPLGFEQKMSLKEILRKHPKGLEYGHIVNKHPVFPILLDAEGKVLSFPPVINSNDLGKITSETRNVLVEVTGTMNEAVLNTVKIVTLSLIDRGGKAHGARIHYPAATEPLITPNLEPRSMDLSSEYVNEVSGLKLTAKQIADLLPKAGYGVEEINGGKVSVMVPSYRVDVMHAVDLVEDVTIAYGYNNIKPLWRRPPTTGALRPEQRLLDVARELMIGLGFQEILTYALTNQDSLFAKMKMRKQPVVEIANPKVQTMTCLRNSLLPSLMEFLSCNTSVEYPQRIFELDKVTLLDKKAETRTRDEDWLAAVVSHPTASFSEIKSDLDSFFMNLGVEWRIKETEHPSFIEGRVGEVIVEKRAVGILGEINPEVLTAWKLENPTVEFELNMENIAGSRHARR
jgi:phenylalanyl-tRNA synthetase beta chain